MKVRYLLTALFALLFAAACNNQSDQPGTDGGETTEEEEVVQPPALQSHFPEVHQYFLSQDSSYSAANFEGGEYLMRDTLPAVPLTPGQLQPFLPYLVFNSTDSLAIDFVSYNYVFGKKNGRNVLMAGGPDTEVGLVDVANNSRKRILFLGSSGSVLDAKWEDDNTLLIVSTMETPEGKITPSILRYHTVTGEYEMYTYQGSIRADINQFMERKLNGMVRTSPVS